MQVANLFLCRSDLDSSFAPRQPDNPLILLGILAELTLILMIDYIPAENQIFGTAPLPPSVWLFLLPFAAGMVALEERRKALVCRWKRRRVALSRSRVPLYVRDAYLAAERRHQLAEVAASEVGRLVGRALAARQAQLTHTFCAGTHIRCTGVSVVPTVDEMMSKF